MVPAEGGCLSPKGVKPDYEIRDCGYTTPCWVWLKTRDKKNYGTGSFLAAGINTGWAHRAYYIAANGEIPPGSAEGVVDHLCRNPPCVNPAHLEFVRQAVNVHRGAKAKLTAEDVETIKARIVACDTMTQIAKDYGVHIDAIYRIAEDSRWRDDPDAPRQPLRPKRDCPGCGEPITEGRRNRIYCSSPCKARFKYRRARALRDSHLTEGDPS